MKLLLFIVTIATVLSCNSTSVDKDSGKSSSTPSGIHKQKSVTFDSSNKEGNVIKFISKYNFETFKAEVYDGKLASPDFSNNPYAVDREYVDFITNGCKQNGINFGGHYTIIQRSCGAMCEHIFIVDRHTGIIFNDINLNDGKYGYAYKKDSRLLIANSNVFIDDKFEYYNDFFDTPELYVWDKTKFIRL